MNKDKLKLVLDLYKEDKINFQQAVLLLDLPNISMPGSFQTEGIVPNIEPYKIIV